MKFKTSKLPKKILSFTLAAMMAFPAVATSFKANAAGIDDVDTKTTVVECFGETFGKYVWENVLGQNTKLKSTDKLEDVANYTELIKNCERFEGFELQNVTEFKNLEYFEGLKTFNLRYGKVETLDFGGLKALKTVFIDDCDTLKEVNFHSSTVESQVETVKITDCKNLKKINLNECSKVGSVTASHNALTEINLAKCSSLTSLDVDNNGLTELNVEAAQGLNTLDCSVNPLTKITFNSASTSLRSIDCSYTNLQELVVPAGNQDFSLNCNDVNTEFKVEDTDDADFPYLISVGKDFKYKNLISILIDGKELDREALDSDDGNQGYKIARDSSDNIIGLQARKNPVGLHMIYRYDVNSTDGNNRNNLVVQATLVNEGFIPGEDPATTDDENKDADNNTTTDETKDADNNTTTDETKDATNTASETTASDSVKTGDNAPIFALAMVLVLSAACVYVFESKKIKNN